MSFVDAHDTQLARQGLDVPQRTTHHGIETRILVEQTTVVDPERLGRSAGRLAAAELRAVDEALMLVLGL